MLKVFLHIFDALHSICVFTYRKRPSIKKIPKVKKIYKCMANLFCLKRFFLKCRLLYVNANRT